jgi:hypothetical protein
MVGKLGVTTAFFVIYLITLEVYIANTKIIQRETKLPIRYRRG